MLINFIIRKRLKLPYLYSRRSTSKSLW
jgi:hypothetical protein